MKKTLVLLISVAMSMSVVNAAGNKKAVVASTIRLSDQEILYNDGIELMKAKEYDDALIKFSAAIATDTSFTNAYFNRALANYYVGNYTKAMYDIETTIRQQGANDTAENHIIKAKIYFGVGNIGSAKDEIAKALEISPNNTNALLDQAALFQSTEQYTDAMASYTTYNYKTGGTATSYNELGNCYNKVGDKAVALECYKKAYAADSTDKLVRFNLCKSVWEVNKDTLKATQMAEALIKDDLTNPDYYNLKGFIYFQMGDTATARTNFNIAIGQNDNLAQAHLGNGLIWMQADNLNEAIKCFNKAISANVNYGEAYINRGIAREGLGDYKGACDDFSRAAELKAENADEYYTKQCK